MVFMCVCVLQFVFSSFFLNHVTNVIFKCYESGNKHKLKRGRKTETSELAKKHRDMQSLTLTVSEGWRWQKWQHGKLTSLATGHSPNLQLENWQNYCSVYKMGKSLFCPTFTNATSLCISVANVLSSLRKTTQDSCNVATKVLKHQVFC